MRLLGDGGEVRCYLDEEDHDLRSAGCKLAVGMLGDEVNLEAALTNVHTFIPVLPDPLRLDDADALASLRSFGIAAAEAAGSAGIEQTILALPRLPAAANPLTEAFDEIASAFAAAVRPLCILRTALVWSEDRPLASIVRRLRGHGPSLPVVSSGEVALALAAVDDREETHGEWELGGRSYPVGELAGLAGAGPAREPSLWVAGILAAPMPVMGHSGSEEFGVPPQPLR